MEILTGLIRLDETGVLPAPWFNRPSLGLKSGTTVRMGVLRTSPADIAPPDIIVTPLSTDRFRCTASVTVDLTERSGAVYEVLDRVSDTFNIGLAETVTVDQRTRHRVTLLLEPTDPFLSHCEKANESDRAEFDKLLDNLKQRLSTIDGYQAFRSDYVADESIRFTHQYESEVRSGAIVSPLMKDYILEFKNKFSNDFDFSRVVVSSNADARFIRYIFPRVGAFEVTISHKDTPSALARISSVFRDLGYNILLSRLSRSGRRSLFVAICEPSTKLTIEPASDVYQDKAFLEIKSRLRNCDPDSNFRLNLTHVSFGSSIQDVAYPNRHNADPVFHQITAPLEMRAYLSKYRTVPQKKVFLSFRERLAKKTESIPIHDTLKAAISESHCILLDGYNLEENSPDDLRARLWMSSAGIFVASPLSEDEDKDVFSPNQMAELGFIYGQGKPWAVVVREGQIRNMKEFLIPEKSFIVYNDYDKFSLLELKVRVVDFLRRNIK